MDKSSFFSIVIPTLNRANYLKLAIESVLNQSFTDYELIVSDNSSTDHTEAVVKEFSDSRIRYVRTPEKLPMGDSWEFALAEARGEYITFLGDDDAYSRIYLESLKRIIDEHGAEVVSCKMADYCHEETGEGGMGTKPNSFVSSPFTNQLAVHKAKDVIRNLFVNLGLSEGVTSEEIQIPQLINTAYHNSILEKIKDRFGRVIPDLLSGDFYLAVMVLHIVEKYYVLDSPLSLHGVSSMSTSISITSREKGSNLMDTQPELAKLTQVPLKLFNPFNFCADAVLSAKLDLTPELDYLEVDFAGYFVRMHQLLHALELEGDEITAETQALLTVLQEQNSKVQERLKSTSLSNLNLLKNRIRRAVPTGLYRFLSRVRNGEKRIIVDGESNNFANIAEFADRVDTDFLNTYASQ